MSTQLELPPPPPPGLNYIAVIQPELTFLLLAVVGGTLFIPVVILLFFFSTSKSRRLPMFYLNVIACSIVLTTAILSAYVHITAILSPEKSLPEATYVALIAISILPPLYYDSILLTRIVAFYPRQSFPLWHLLRAIAFPVMLKIVRFAAIASYLHQLTKAARDLGNILLVGQATWFRNKWMMTEWALQVVDNSYVTLFFLYKMQVFYRKGKTDSVYRGRSIMAKIKGLLYIAIGNFIFPLMLNIAQLVMIASQPNYLKGSDVLVSNSYITPLGVVFATIWTSSYSWADSHSPQGTVTANSTFHSSLQAFKARRNRTEDYSLNQISTGPTRIDVEVSSYVHKDMKSYDLESRDSRSANH